MPSFSNRLRTATARLSYIALKRASQRMPMELVVPVRSRVLVVSPHMDDEVMACGGNLLLHRQLGSEVRVVYVSDSSADLPDPSAGRLRAARHAEMTRVRSVLHLHSVIELAFPDGKLVSYERDIATRLARELEDFSPTMVFCPFPLDGHGDHQACAFALSSATRLAGWEGDVLAYEVWSALTPNIAIDIGSVVEEKAELIRMYTSQTQDRDYESAFIGLNRYRGLPYRIAFAEAFHRCTARQFGALAASLNSVSSAVGKSLRA
ncbi:MAG: PIG-L deacetylase family protein [Acidobacteriota bacterium]